MLCIRLLQRSRWTKITRQLTIGGDTYSKKGDYISLDGTAGEVLKGQIKTVPPELSGDFAKIMSWADEIRTLKIRTNADNPRDAKAGSCTSEQKVSVSAEQSTCSSKKKGSLRSEE